MPLGSSEAGAGAGAGRMTKRIDWSKVAERLALIRAALGVSQVNICAATGISTSSWNRFEKGERKILPDDVAALLDVYGVDPNFIYFGREDGLPAGILTSIRCFRASI